ncbi:hypothetical protein VIGAN_08002200 [Vigna angularis var. angularis]|uniref:Bifunctional inhibitor/plant lipid transfer protein/seed storage helical domain-containing protein n=2 Tax=Phaseolus angularis TaxID=3914 RepID=A0A0S3SL70_PHAAN|nr:putative lipid-transfer protein DIR1 [Vigna angularis]BAT93512.1 hypothetical protein VIGAN_08002200 [Vigna angularis var. angularis]
MQKLSRAQRWKAINRREKDGERHQNKNKKMTKMNARVVAVVMLMEVLFMGAAIDALNVCGVSSTDLLKCLPAVTPPSPSEPSKECCSAVDLVDLKCLCAFKSSPLLPALQIDPDLALQLPAKCKLGKTVPC